MFNIFNNLTNDDLRVYDKIINYVIGGLLGAFMLNVILYDKWYAAIEAAHLPVNLYMADLIGDPIVVLMLLVSAKIWIGKKLKDD